MGGKKNSVLSFIGSITLYHDAKILVIQTAFIGDVVLATGILEKLHAYYPAAAIDILVRKGNEGLFYSHPFLNETLVWDKKKDKYKHLWETCQQVRLKKYDLLINVQRFAATGLLAILSGATHTIGFDKNPLSFLFSKKIKHIVSTEGKTLHEIERNHTLIRDITDGQPAKPRLYPPDEDYTWVAQWQRQPYICIAPASVWFTKQYPIEKWVELIGALPQNIIVYLLGAPGDDLLCTTIKTAADHPQVINLAGKMSFLQSAAMMGGALMNYVNDSAPMHFASAVNAPVTAVYCSTIPGFGFGPLSDNSHIVEVQQELACRPCGLHGHKTCPQGHFNCAMKIEVGELTGNLTY